MPDDRTEKTERRMPPGTDAAGPSPDDRPNGAGAVPAETAPSGACVPATVLPSAGDGPSGRPGGPAPAAVEKAAETAGTTEPGKADGPAATGSPTAERTDGAAPAPASEHSPQPEDETFRKRLPEAEASEPEPAAPAGTRTVLRAGGFTRSLSGTAAAMLLFAAVGTALTHLPDWTAGIRLAVFGGAAAAAMTALLALLLHRRPSPGLLDAAGTTFGLLLGLFLFTFSATWPSGEGLPALVAAWALLLTPWLLLVRRPAFLSLWFLAALGALVLEGGTQWRTGFTDVPRTLLETLPAALFSTLVLCLGAPFARSAAAPAGRRAALLAPAAATLLLCGILPATAFGTGASTGLVPAVSGLLLVPSGIAVLAARRAELVTLLLVGLAAWANAFLLRGLALLGLSSDAVLLYALTVVNGLLLLPAGFLCHLHHRRLERSGNAAPSGTGLSLYALIADAVPGTVRALLGALALALVVASALEFSPFGQSVLGPLLFILGLAAGFFLRCRPRTPGLSEAGLLGLVLAAAGWLVIVWGPSLEGVAAAGILPTTALPAVAAALALLAAWVLRSRAAFAAALLAPLAVPAGEPSAAVADCIPAAVSAGLLVFSIFRKDMRTALAGLLAAAATALWLAPFLTASSGLTDGSIPLLQDAMPWFGTVVRNASPEAFLLVAAGMIPALGSAFRGQALRALRTGTAWFGALLSGLALGDAVALPLAVTLLLGPALRNAGEEKGGRLEETSALALVLALLLLDGTACLCRLPAAEGLPRLALAALGLLLCAASGLSRRQEPADSAASGGRTGLHRPSPLLLLRRTAALILAAATAGLLACGISGRSAIVHDTPEIRLPATAAGSLHLPVGSVLILDYAAGSDVSAADRRAWCLGETVSRAAAPEACPAESLSAVPADREGRPRLPTVLLLPQAAPAPGTALETILHCRGTLCLLSSVTSETRHP